MAALNSLQYLSGFGLALLTWSAIVPAALTSTYVSDTRKTILHLEEDQQPISGRYSTVIKGKTWLGEVQITKTERGSGNAVYIGSFRDEKLGTGANEICQGNIRLVRSQPAGRTSAALLKVTWQISGKQGRCSMGGQTIEMTLQEGVPIANRRGNYTDRNSSIWQGGTQDGSWRYWRIVSADGSLNCRQSPNGPIVRTYKTGDRIQARSDRSGSAFVDVTRDSVLSESTEPWLRTQHNCFVRANTQFIRATSYLD
jgi:hypothetical protein